MHAELVHAEEVSMSRLRGGRTGGEAKMSSDGEAVEGVGPVPDPCIGEIGLGTGVGVFVFGGVDVGLWLWLRAAEGWRNVRRRPGRARRGPRVRGKAKSADLVVLHSDRLGWISCPVAVELAAAVAAGAAKVLL